MDKLTLKKAQFAGMKEFEKNPFMQRRQARKDAAMFAEGVARYPIKRIPMGVSGETHLYHNYIIEVLAYAEKRECFTRREWNTYAVRESRITVRLAKEVLDYTVDKGWVVVFRPCPRVVRMKITPTGTNKLKSQKGN